MGPLLYVVIGFFTGILSGIIGIGGGTVLIPIMVFIFGMSQHQAQGTTLALMVPPIGLLAAWRYYQAGHVNVPMAIWICAGFFLGGLIGAHFVSYVPDMLLKKIFGIFLLVISVRMIFA